MKKYTRTFSSKLAVRETLEARHEDRQIKNSMSQKDGFIKMAGLLKIFQH